MFGRVRQNNIDREAGFTLVELAVVMVIIGLLIGGILKGQEMIANAQVTATIAQTKAVDAATAKFRDIFEAFPGDMADASTRLPTAPINGNGNNVLDSAPFGAAGAEVALFYIHLEAADLLIGVNGFGFLGAKMTGVEVRAGFTAGGVAIGQNPAARRGHYLTLVPDGSDGGAILSPLQAARFDRKLDDGSPFRGSVFPDLAACASQVGYLESVHTGSCSLAIRLQG